LSHRTPQHIRIKPEDVADRAVVVGDPARAKFIADNFLEGAKLVNEERGYHVYTGYYKGQKISVAVHGIGGPSAAIVFEELHMLGVKVMVRLGTCGGMIPELDIGDLVVATGATYNCGGTIGAYVPESCMVTAPTPDLTVELYKNARQQTERIFAGPVFSSDAFYAEDPEFARRWASRGVIAVEMEAATLFALGTLRGFRTAALLVVADNLVVPGKQELKHHEELQEYINKATKAVLETLASYTPIIPLHTKRSF